MLNEKKLIAEVFDITKHKGYDGGNGGEPPMEINERVATLEAIIPTLATKTGIAETKADISALRADMHEGFSGMVKWIVGAAIGLGAAGITVMTFVLNNAIPKAPPHQPIIITLPAAATAAVDSGQKQKK